MRGVEWRDFEALLDGSQLFQHRSSQRQELVGGGGAGAANIEVRGIAYRRQRTALHLAVTVAQTCYHPHDHHHPHFLREVKCLPDHLLGFLGSGRLQHRQARKGCQGARINFHTAGHGSGVVTGDQHHAAPTARHAEGIHKIDAKGDAVVLHSHQGAQTCKRGGCRCLHGHGLVDAPLHVYSVCGIAAEKTEDLRGRVAGIAGCKTHTRLQGAAGDSGIAHKQGGGRTT